MKTEAWVLYRGTKHNANALEDGTFRKESFQLPEMGDEDILVETLYGSWEGNMSHAILRDPIDICRQRREEKIILGNAAVARILKKGRLVPATYRVGDIGLISSAKSLCDPYGYMELAYAYDAPQTIGLLSKQTVVNHGHFHALPESSLSLQQWAAFSLKYPTAYSNWKMASGVYRLQVSREQNPSPTVFGWGGGTTIAELELAQHFGYQTYAFTSHPERQEYLQKRGIHAIDRAEIADLALETSDPKDHVSQRRYIKAFANFRRLVKRESRNQGIDIFIDYINTCPHSTRRIVNREGVITTAGWKYGVEYPVNRANECIRRHTHVHTHFASLTELKESMNYAATHQWMPEVSDADVFAWEDIAELAQRHINGRVTSLFPLFKVND